MASLHGAHRTSDAYVISLVEDFCKSPTAPVGYVISQKLELATRVCTSVHGNGTPVLNLNCRLMSVTGNEAGVGGGIVSGVNVGMCRPILAFSPTVRSEGQFVLRHDTIMEMNCAGPEGVGNTLGKIVYVTTYNQPPATKSYSESNTEKPPAACQDGLEENNDPNADWKHPVGPKVGEVELPNGQKIPILEGEWGGSGSGPNAQYQPGEGRIIVSKDAEGVWRDKTLKHETQHAIDDARDGQLNGELHDEQGKKLNRAGAESRARAAAAKFLRSKAAEIGCHWFKAATIGCGDKGVLVRAANDEEQLSQAYKEASEAIEKGDYQKAWEIAGENPSMCQDIQGAIEEAKGVATP